MPNPQRVQATVEWIEDHGSGVYTVRFAVPARATRFKPGQFLHLALDQFDPTQAYWPESRVFSIASKPRSEDLEIVYSVKGNFTERMSRKLSVGRSVWLKLPYGDFIVENHIKEHNNVVFVAGGTGISPFIPYLLENDGQIPMRPVALYYGIRDSKRFLYRNVVERLSQTPGMAVSIWSEHDGAIPPFVTRPGKFNVDLIGDEIVQKTNVVCFLSGPLGMIRAFQTTLYEKGLSSGQIIVDDWE